MHARKTENSPQQRLASRRRINHLHTAVLLAEVRLLAYSVYQLKENFLVLVLLLFFPHEFILR